MFSRNSECAADDYKCAGGCLGCVGCLGCAECLGCARCLGYAADDYECAADDYEFPADDYERAGGCLGCLGRPGCLGCAGCLGSAADDSEYAAACSDVPFFPDIMFFPNFWVPPNFSNVLFLECPRLRTAEGTGRTDGETPRRRQGAGLFTSPGSCGFRTSVAAPHSDNLR